MIALQPLLTDNRHEHQKSSVYKDKEGEAVSVQSSWWSDRFRDGESEAQRHRSHGGIYPDVDRQVQETVDKDQGLAAMPRLEQPQVR